MSDEKYQGWANRLTWVVSLHLNNDESLYRYCVELAKSSSTKYELADEIEKFVGELLAEWEGTAQKSLMFSDVLQHAVWTVDWVEIAESFLEE